MMMHRSNRGRVLVLALALGAGGCGRKPAPAPTPVPAAPVAGSIGVEAVTVASESTEVRAVAASVHARREAALSARMTASVRVLPYREGDHAAAGTVVVELDDAAARAALAAANAAERTAAADHGRMESLARQDAATTREVEAAWARAEEARARVAAIRNELAYAVLRAPFAGTITRVPVHAGDIVSPGQVLVEMEGDDGYEVRAALEADLARRLMPGAVLRAAVDGLDAPLEARVASLSPAGDHATHRFEVRADLTAAPGLRSGLFARILIAADAPEAALLVPASSVLERGGLTGVFVIDEGRARLRWVALGAARGELREVRAGLAAGERIARSPVGLADGAAVSEAR